VLEASEGWLAETVAILEYLEDAIEGPALHPADPFLRARGRQIMNIVQLYVEAPVRSLFPGVFLGGTNSAATVEAARSTLDRATAALDRLVAPAPFVLGEGLSDADLFAFYCLDLADRVTQFVWDRSVLHEIGWGRNWFAHMARRESSQVVLRDFETAFAAYLIEKGAAYRPRPNRRCRKDSTCAA
jgi:glutathione S-transferase